MQLRSSSFWLLFVPHLVWTAAAEQDQDQDQDHHGGGSAPERRRLVIGFQAPWNVSLPFSALRLGSALQMAVEKVNREPGLLGNYTLDFVLTDTGCEPKTSLRSFIQQVWKEKVAALFGPACPEEAEVGPGSFDLGCVSIHGLHQGVHSKGGYVKYTWCTSVSQNVLLLLLPFLKTELCSQNTAIYRSDDN